MIDGLIEALYEVGYEKTTVSLIGARAGVSKSDFYKHFESKDDCFIAAYEVATERIRARIGDACEEAKAQGWEQRVRAAVDALLELFAEEPPLAGIFLVEGLRAGRGVYDRYQAALDSFVGELRADAPGGPSGTEVPAATGEAVVGGVASLLGRRALAGESEQLPGLFPEILEFILAAYVGGEEARRIVSAG